VTYCQVLLRIENLAEDNSYYLAIFPLIALLTGKATCLAL